MAGGEPRFAPLCTDLSALQFTSPSGGDRIRTCGGVTLTTLAKWRYRPLSHPSKRAGSFRVVVLAKVKTTYQPKGSVLAWRCSTPSVHHDADPSSAGESRTHSIRHFECLWSAIAYRASSELLKFPLGYRTALRALKSSGGIEPHDATPMFHVSDFADRLGDRCSKTVVN